MIKVTVLYPYDPEKTFDLDYYTGTHGPLVHRLMGPMGLVRTEAEKGVSGTDPNSPPPFVVVGHLYFNTTDEVHEAFKTHGREVLGDIKNYTDIQPTFQIGETIDYPAK